MCFHQVVQCSSMEGSVLKPQWVYCASTLQYCAIPLGYWFLSGICLLLSGSVTFFCQRLLCVSARGCWVSISVLCASIRELCASPKGWYVLLSWMSCAYTKGYCVHHHGAIECFYQGSLCTFTWLCVLLLGSVCASNRGCSVLPLSGTMFWPLSYHPAAVPGAQKT